MKKTAEIDVYGGMLGAGKTTLIKQMLKAAYKNRKVALIENEIGAVNFDSEELRASSIELREITSGCICCTVKGSFSRAIERIMEDLMPDVIIVEPSGAADLSALLGECRKIACVRLNRVIMLVNAKKTVALLSVIGDFYRDQLRAASVAYLNFTEQLSEKELQAARDSLLEINPDLIIVETPLAEISGETFPAQSREEEEPFLLLSPGRNVRREKSGYIRKASRSEDGLENWLYEFETAFTESRIKKLFQYLENDSAGKVWRMKGYLKMTGGGVKKVDTVFGDAFAVDSDLNLGENANCIVLIGRDLNKAWLTAAFETLDRY